MPQSTTAVAAPSPQRVTAGRPSSFSLLAPVVGEHGAISGMPYYGSRGADAAAASLHKAGWSPHAAARHVADTIAIRER